MIPIDLSLVHIVAACAVLGFAVVAFGALLGIRP
jgi:hypothetical protein